MDEMIQWLKTMETSAGSLYGYAAEEFSRDPELTKFLKELADDEMDHYETIQAVEEHIKTLPGYEHFITVDEDIRKKLHAEFAECRKKLDGKCLTEDALLKCIITTEFSEWNDIFIYAINALKASSRERLPQVAEIDRHRKYIEEFLKPRRRDLLEKLKKLPQFLDVNLLVVETSKPAVELLAAILGNEGNVETAGSIREALNKISAKYFAAIVTGVDMSIKDEMTFYDDIERSYPAIKKRILSFTSSDDAARINFLVRNRINYLIKPASINQVRKKIGEILSRRLD